MHPYLFELWGVAIPAYPILLSSAFGLATVLLFVLLRNDGASLLHCSCVGLAAALGTLFGAYAFALVQTGSASMRAGGLVFYGGLISGGIAGLIAARLSGLSILALCAACTVCLPLGYAIGRLGCFCRGCCFGIPTSLPFGVRFGVHYDLDGQIIGSQAYLWSIQNGVGTAQYSTSVHATQLYEAAIATITACVFLVVLRRAGRRPWLLPLYLMVYSIERWIIELIRQEPLVAMGMTAAQLISIAMFFVSWGIAAAMLRSQRLRGSARAAQVR